MISLKARDVMTRNVLTIGPELPIRSLAEFLIDHRISAVPVVDSAAVPLGVVSEGDLLRRVELGTEKKRAWWVSMLADPDDDARSFVKTHGLVAADVMTRGVIAVSPDVELRAIANLLDEKKIKRLFVLDAGKIVGVVTRSDIVKTLMNRVEGGTRHRLDSEIRADIDKQMHDQPWAPNAFISVLVNDGTVELVGAVQSVAQREAMNVLAQRVDGVRAVKDQLVVRKINTAWIT